MVSLVRHTHRYHTSHFILSCLISCVAWSIVFCSRNPCMYGGTCTELPAGGQYSCACVPGAQSFVPCIAPLGLRRFFCTLQVTTALIVKSTLMVRVATLLAVLCRGCDDCLSSYANSSSRCCARRRVSVFALRERRHLCGRPVRLCAFTTSCSIYRLAAPWLLLCPVSYAADYRIRAHASPASPASIARLISMSAPHRLAAPARVVRAC
jgi:hypothetical protein